MKGKLRKISKVVKVLRSIPMAQGIRANLSVDWSKEEEFSNGIMVKSMMGNGKMEGRMEAECGKGSMDNHISDNGRTER